MFSTYKMLDPTKPSLDFLLIKTSSFSRERCYASFLCKKKDLGCEKLINNV